MLEILPNWHPILVHFTVALFVTSVALFVIGIVMKNRAWAPGLLTTAYWNLWLGAGITVLTIAAGFYAYNTVAHDDPSHAAMTDHRNWALGTAVLFWALALWTGWARKQGGDKSSVLFVVVLLLSSGVLLTTAWKGGELVYRYGLGVLSLPQPEGEGHEHNEDQNYSREQEPIDDHDH